MHFTHFFHISGKYFLNYIATNYYNTHTHTHTHTSVYILIHGVTILTTEGDASDMVYFYQPFSLEHFFYYVSKLVFSLWYILSFWFEN